MSGVRLLDHWAPPDGSGTPIACLATTFTFESDFFLQDCLSRFLSLSMVTSEGDQISTIAAVLEEEDRLSETQVTVLVDRSSPAEKRNLRWDLLPVHVRGGLLHAKVAALIWERSARVILGSANLTSAGYRRQIELALTIDLDDNCRVPRPVVDDLIAELRRLVDLVPATASGARARAVSTLDTLAARVEELGLPAAGPSNQRLAVAPARPGLSPLAVFDRVWSGSQPIEATVLSPFWDSTAPAPAIDAIRRRLTGRPAHRRALTAVAARDPYTGALRAPGTLADEPLVQVVAFDPPDSEPRTLHAKTVVFESDTWVAALVGSSNATEAGFGLDAHSGHHELNLWIGCPATSQAGKQLRELACPGEPVDFDDDEWQPDADEDEPTAPSLPLGFETCTLDARSPARVHLHFVPSHLPTSWEIRTPADTPVLNATAWSEAGSPKALTVPLSDAALPAFLMVRWEQDGDSLQATWTTNVDDRAALPPPAELAELDVDTLLRALASTRPLPVALERELRRREKHGGSDRRTELDPLRRFDDRGLLLHRARQLSQSLWRLQDRLARPATSVDAVHWRLFGPVGPLALADGLVRTAQTDTYIPGEAHFLVGELALTVAAVDWGSVAGDTMDRKALKKLVAQLLEEIAARLEALPLLDDLALTQYVHDALSAASR